MKPALALQQQGRYVASPNQTLEKYLEAWLEDVKLAVRPKTYEAYDLNVRRVVPHIGSRRLGDLTPAHIQQCYRNLLNRGLSERSVEQAHTVLHAALQRALKLDLIGRNPTDAATAPRPTKKEMHPLTARQVRDLFTASEEHRLHALWVLLTTTGLRVGEATALAWEDFDPVASTIVVRRALQRQRGSGMVFVEPKTERSRRTVHLAPITAGALDGHKRRQAEERLEIGPGWPDSKLIFRNIAGERLDPSNAYESLQRLLKRANLPRIRVHDLRHTAATLLLTDGVNPKVVQEMLGHSTVVLTLETYSHVMPGLHKEAAHRMEHMVGSEARVVTLP